MRLTSTLTVLALGLAVVTASHAGINDFKFSTNQTGFVFNNTWYKGSVTTGGVTYAPGATLNLTTLPKFTFVNATADAGTSNPKVYRIYRQDYSNIIGNVEYTSTDRTFVHDVVGQNTVASALPTTGTYNYTGKIFAHLADGGDFNYQINLANKKGKGSFSNFTVATSLGDAVAKGNLSEQTLTTQADGTFGVKGAAVTGITTNNVLVNAFISTANTKYDIGVFGPNGE